MIQLIFLLAIPVFANWSINNQSAIVEFKQLQNQPPALVRWETSTHGSLQEIIPSLDLWCGKSAEGQWQLANRSATQLIFNGYSESCGGIQTELKYSLNDRNIQVEAIVTATHPVELINGLSIRLSGGVKAITGSNHQAIVSTQMIEGAKDRYLSLKQFLTLHRQNSTICAFIPNAYQSHLRVTNDGNAYLDLAQYLKPKSDVSDSGSWSSIGPRDTLKLMASISFEDFLRNPIFISEHPFGAEQQLTMYLDELPNRDLWTPVSIENNPSTPVYSQLVTLLNTFSKMKMGWLLLPDRHLLRPFSNWPHWNVNHYRIIPDTLTEYSGESSVLFYSEKSDTLSMSQEFMAEDSILWVKVAHKSDISQRSYHLCITNSNQTKCTLFTADTIWSNQASKWTIQPGSTKIQIKSSSLGKLWIDEIRAGSSLLDMDNQLLNADYEEYHAEIIYDHPRRHWSDAHGVEYVVNAPEYYKQFLRNLENDITQYGWEDRVRIGSHGYHHTSEIGRPEPEHEFEFFDPFGDSLRISRIFSDFYHIGLTSKSLRFWRTPGIASTRSLIHPLVEMGVAWIDPGWWIEQYEDRYYFIQRNSNRVWGNSLSWWSDRSFPANGRKSHWEVNPNWLFSSLRKGHLAHIGGHPEAWLHSDGSALQPTIQLFTEIENQFPYLHYTFPDEYADYANQVSQVQLSQSYSLDSLELHFTGIIPKGFTLIFQGDYTEPLLSQIFKSKGLSVQMRTLNGFGIASPQCNVRRIAVWFENSWNATTTKLRFPWQKRLGTWTVNGRKTEINTESSLWKIHIYKAEEQLNPVLR